MPLRGHGLVSRVRDQVSTSAVRPLATRLELTLKEVATLLALTERTLARRLEEPDGKLDTIESERLLLLHNLAIHGLAVFEDASKFNHWLRRPLSVLDGRSPLAYLDTATSFQVVDQLLGRLEHGVYS
jgi:putative toxin-antitoxin system antitoxin component (TIGR02293 family)